MTAQLDTDSSNSSLNQSKVIRLSILYAFSRVTGAFNVVVLPLFALAIGQDEAFYGVLTAAAGYVQATVLFPSGQLSDKNGRGIAILLGGLFAGPCLLILPFLSDPFLILVTYALTGVGNGFITTSVNSLIADYTEKGDERTKSYGITISAATCAAVLGSFIAGLILDPFAFPGINPMQARFVITFIVMGSSMIATGASGLFTERWLNKYCQIPVTIEEIDEENGPRAKQDLRTAILFGTSQLIMGISSGMVIPYLIPWINAAFTPDPVVLGSVPAIANITLATGTLYVGMSSERVGKLKMIGILYILAPILTFGLVLTPIFHIMVIFYVTRMAVANMARPANNSLFMEEIGKSRRGRSLAISRIMWNFPRQTGTLLTAIILSIGIFSGIVEFGVFIFPLVMCLYPLAVIPMWLALRLNRRDERLEEIEPKEEM